MAKKKKAKKRVELDPSVLLRNNLLDEAIHYKSKLQEEKSLFTSITRENESLVNNLAILEAQLDGEKENYGEIKAKIIEDDLRQRKDEDDLKNTIMSQIIESHEKLTEKRIALGQKLTDKFKDHYSNENKEAENRYTLALKKKLEVEKTHVRNIIALNVAQAEEFENLESESMSHARESLVKHQYRMNTLRSKSERRVQLQIDELVKVNDEQLATVKKDNIASLMKIKQYFSDITHNNLDLIRNLKEELQKEQASVTTNQRRHNELQQLNLKMSEPLRTAEDEIKDCEQEVKAHEQLKQKLKALDVELKAKFKQCQEEDFKVEVLRQKNALLQKKRNETMRKLNKITTKIEVLTKLQVADNKNFESS